MLADKRVGNPNSQANGILRGGMRYNQKRADAAFPKENGVGYSFHTWWMSYRTISFMDGPWSSKLASN
jgi:hypothetical protein